MRCDFCIDEGLKEHIEEFTKRNWQRSHVKNVIFRSLVFLTWLKFMHARKHSLETTRLECFQYDKTFAEKKLSHTTLIRHTLDKEITSAQNVRKLWSQVVHWGSTCEYTQDKNHTNAANVWSHLRKITLWIIRRFMPGSGFSPAFTVKNQWWPKETFEDPLIKEHKIMDL